MDEKKALMNTVRSSDWFRSKCRGVYNNRHMLAQFNMFYERKNVRKKLVMQTIWKCE